MRKNAKKATKRTCSMALAAVLAFAPVTVFGATDTANHWANAVISDWESKGLIKAMKTAHLSRTIVLAVQNLLP
nr:hypothetical protein [uncultured Anaerotignum sp.]